MTWSVHRSHESGATDTLNTTVAVRASSRSRGPPVPGEALIALERVSLCNPGRELAICLPGLGNKHPPPCLIEKIGRLLGE